MQTSGAQLSPDRRQTVLVSGGCPDVCPRCQADLAHAYREVSLLAVMDDGEEVRVRGHACARCGWCCTNGLEGD